jgi:hypothetical protein
MVNSQVVTEIVNALKTDIRVENIPTPIPVIEVGIKSIKNSLTAHNTLSNAVSATILTTSAVADTYITHVQLSYIKDVTSTCANITIDTSQNGQSKKLVNIACLSLTAQTGEVFLVFKHPIKVDRSSIINITSTTNVANINVTATIGYFIDEVS